MIRRHIIAICLIISSFFMCIATAYYPGGSLIDNNSVGFDWFNNFFSNLFEKNALNGMPNDSRPWALFGLALHSLGYGIFFLRMSRKIGNEHAALVLKIIGVANVLFTFLIATAWHDLMVNISATLFLIGIFYITVFLFKTRLRLLQLACIIGMIIFYVTLFLYGTGQWAALAGMQKVAFLCSMILILFLEYFTNTTDFIPKNTKGLN